MRRIKKIYAVTIHVEIDAADKEALGHALRDLELYPPYIDTVCSSGYGIKSMQYVKIKTAKK